MKKEKSPDWDTALRIAVAGLQEQGATEIYVFGSYAEGRARPSSDLDLAVRGIPSERWFYAIAQALRDVPVPVDVIDLDSPSRLSAFLVRTGRIKRVA